MTASVVQPGPAVRALDPLRKAVRWAFDRVVSVGYGMVYDAIVQRFPPYQSLHREVLERVERTAPPLGQRRSVRVLDVGCGPGLLTLRLAEAGFDAVGVDSYEGLLELAREKRRAGHLPNLAFRSAEAGPGSAFAAESFDQVVNVHSLYVHPDPQGLVADGFRLLRPGGHAVFVNFTRRVHLWASLAEVYRRRGLRAAWQSLLWVLPNAVFEVGRKPIGPHYWEEDEFRSRLERAGFTVLELKRTFFEEASLLAWVRKSRGEVPAAERSRGEGGRDG